MPKILLVQGPNMAFLGKREPERYGTTTAKELDSLCMAHAQRNNYELDIFYSNSEGPIIDRIYEAMDGGLNGIVMNPAAVLFTGYGLRACLKAVGIPYIEVHMLNTDARGISSILAPVAHGVIHGFGIDTYRMGLEAMLRILTNNKSWV